jgi:hypothetical protein
MNKKGRLTPALVFRLKAEATNQPSPGLADRGLADYAHPLVVPQFEHL